MLADAHRFGFDNGADAASYLDALLERIAAAFDGAAPVLDHDWRQVLHERLLHNLAVLRAQPG